MRSLLSTRPHCYPSCPVPAPQPSPSPAPVCPSPPNETNLDHARDGRRGRLQPCLSRDSKTVLIITSILFSRMKFTRSSQLSDLPFTNRKDFVLILLLPSRKEKRAHPVPVGQHHLPVCPEPSTDGFGAGGINGNCVYFMSCRKLAVEPSGRLSWGKKKMIVSYAVCLLFGKIYGVILS